LRADDPGRRPRLGGDEGWGERVNGTHAANSTVSVILPTFNRARYIAAAIASVLAQTRPPDEIVIVDDGSTDGTESVCATFGPQIRYRRMDRNRGKTAAINFGLSQTSGTYVWIMDDDDIATPDALESLMAPLEAKPETGFSFGALLKFTETDDGVRTFQPQASVQACGMRSLFVRLMEECFITGHPCTLFRRSRLDEVGKLDETVVAGVDYNMLLQVARISDGADVGKVVLWQRQHSGARGPAHMNYAVGERNKRWKEFDARLLRELLPKLRLPEFLGRRQVDAGLSELETRQALVQKASIATSKGLWDIAAASLEQARAAAGDAPLSFIETCILSQALGSRYGIDDFVGDAAVQHRLAAAAGVGELGDRMREMAASRLTFWVGSAVRGGDFGGAWKASLALMRLARWRAARVALAPILVRIGMVKRCRAACRAAKFG
jgi:hypothetical protein